MEYQLLAVLGLLGLAIYHLIVYPAFLSPLAKAPNAHWSVPFSNLWVLYHRWREDITPVTHTAHQKHGPIVRLGPNDLSVNSVDGGIRTVYGGGYEKGTWYVNGFNNYGFMPMFAMPDHGNHSRRKRMLSNIYAKSSLQNHQALGVISSALLDGRLKPLLRRVVASGQPVEFYYIFAAIMHDFVTAYVFGLRNGTNLTDYPDKTARFLEDYKARQRFHFWPQEMPWSTWCLDQIGLKWLVVPQWVDQANADLEASLLRMCIGAQETLRESECAPEDYPTVYAQLVNALALADKASVNGTADNRQLSVASELLDHTLAGFDTSSITLTFYAWQISKPDHKDWQRRLCEELQGVDVHDAKALDALPVLHATLMETLRLHTAIPGPQPRVTPAGATFGTLIGLPSGVRVQSQAWSLHRNESVFPDAEAWRPERWLNADEKHRREMNKWFWAFSSGGRMCIGSNLAMLDMKATVAAIWSEFETDVAYDNGMVQRGGYVAEPVGADGKYCLLRVQKAEV
ncbi:putative P450 monooxygenase [Piedraia hortae CBS 480.64]|uniref:Putative P450 monooxygenase n=1 Tax=Piedraia hortae CBS 480.64 TaxID=1314780 RepID=A0A6A7C6Y0_9PEZI|nr:putative P450 monooxygenase [Piedraia hortae CBS 480.64]